MKNKKNTFRDELLGMEKPNADYKKNYERQVKEMVEKKLTGLRKWGTIAGLVMGLGFFVLFGTLAIITPKEFPSWGRAIWAIGSLFGLAFAILSALVLKKGTVNLKTDDMAFAGLAWGFIVIVSTITLVNAGRLSDPTIAIKMLVSLLIFEVMAAAGLRKAIIERSGVNTREKLLEIEYRLADLAEKMENNKKNSKE